MTDPTPGEEEDEDDWSPRENPGQPVPWGRVLDAARLAKGISLATDLTRADSEAVSRAIVKTATSRPRTGETGNKRVLVQLPGWGSFGVLVRAARDSGRVTKSGSPVGMSFVLVETAPGERPRRSLKNISVASLELKSGRVVTIMSRTTSDATRRDAGRRRRLGGAAG